MAYFTLKARSTNAFRFKKGKSILKKLSFFTISFHPKELLISKVIIPVKINAKIKQQSLKQYES
jgi:hypothetical protein